MKIDERKLNNLVFECDSFIRLIANENYDISDLENYVDSLKVEADKMLKVINEYKVENGGY